MNNWIQWFEIPVYKFDQAKLFYETLFDIRLEIMDLGALTMAVFPPSLASGALCQGEWYHPSENGVTLHLKVDSLEQALSNVEALGGSILQPKKQISTELGYMALIKDCEGNRLVLRARQ
ncbi:VOC family protein [Spirosoma sp. BT702]|uniref:VOC family protein n=1 Tax=Spirosoma profusum TaxID=2771354 RepID=A0A927AN87_9BACT|nr:VOC family protein [Spirosoma profusum]MBD2701339.1 VOC family protein [Spirosoma profusum]